MHARPRFNLIVFFILGMLAVLTSPARAEEADTRARQVWQLLDYLAVDYGGAVSGGKVTEASEYTEMQDFALNAEKQLKELPQNDGSAQMSAQAAQLRQLINDKADPAVVGEHAHKLAADVLKFYPFPVAPTGPPNVKLGAQLFQAQCASCHGASGKGDGPLAASLNPKPIALTDHARARERTLFSLYQILSNGVAGTAMPSFSKLSDDDRWALAFFVGTMSYSESEQAAGAGLWKSDTTARTKIAGLAALTQLSEVELAKQVGDTSAAPLMAYLRASPDALLATQGRSTAFAKQTLRESVAAFEKGDRSAATRLALSAYLDGFETLEPALAAKDRNLFQGVEKSMIGFRAVISSGSLDDVKAAESHLQQLLDRTQAALAPSEGDSLTAFFGAFTILLREGLEALLVVVAMIAFLKKAERRDVLPYVHAGWVIALAAGGVTWGIATYLVGISGANRELTEGFSSLFAAVVLLSVGIWMHQKSAAGRWQQYLKEKMSAAMGRRAAWFMFLLAFVAVYREVFETVLFFAALWTDGNGTALLAGLACGVVALGVIAALLLRTSARLPIGQFFAASSLLVALLAIVLAGKGIAALQEAGLIPITSVLFPRVDVLGMYPTAQTVLAQAAVLAVAVIAYFMNMRPAVGKKKT